jgi:gas vesicle structural protein
MTVAQRHVAQQYAGRGGPSGLADVLEVLLDKGLVIDAYVRVSLVGIELLTVDARVVVASVDTYLRFAEAVNRLDLTQASNAQTLGDLVSGKSGGSRGRDSGPEDEGKSAHDASSNGNGRRNVIERALHRGDDERAEERDRPEASGARRDLDTSSDDGSEPGPHDDGPEARSTQESPDEMAEDPADAGRDEAEAGGGDDRREQGGDEEGQDDDGPGLLSWIKERGQAF